MYGNIASTTTTTRRSFDNERGGGADAQFPDYLKPHKGLDGRPLGIITKSHPILATQGFQRIQDYALQQQSAKLLHGKSRVCFVVNVKLIKIEIDRLSIIQTLNEHILRMFKDAVLSGIAKSALKDH